MRNALGVPSNIVLFGSTSDIGKETLYQLIAPGVQKVALVSRDMSRSREVEAEIVRRNANVSVTQYLFDASATSSMQEISQRITSELGDIDVAIVAHAVLGDDIDGFSEPSRVADILDINMTATCALLYSLADIMKKQGHGRIALFSSVAGVRVRKANPVYGASKAGIDAFALALDHELSDSGVSIVVIRPGYVHTKMTAHMKPAPFSTTAEKVAKASAAAIMGKTKVVWVPGALKWIFGILRVLPLGAWRRLPIHN